MKKLLAILFFTSTYAFPYISAQESNILSYFNAQVFNDNVVLTWNIKEGDNCNGITIYHSLNMQNFTEIGSIPGLCGAVDENEPYKFVHTDPKSNQDNYYRLALGGQGLSSTLEISFYKTGGKGFTFFPNPGIDVLNLFVNDNFKNAYFELIDSGGKKIIEKKIPSGQLTSLDISGIGSGVYVIRMLDENKLIASDRFVKL